ncbi:MAG TPA: carboxypeptidase regulatory-like domain-containing protein, partial [Thermoplasmata archaeon]|nr:carboxypeptidase regulatory-like domain-containing protein [Thermoplasmata archaeon]
VSPWELITVTQGTSVHTIPLGPVAAVKICTVTNICAPGAGGGTNIAPNGTFLVWGEPGTNDLVTVSPSAPGTSTTATGGMVGATATISVPSTTTNVSVPGVIPLPIFASVTFNVIDNLSWKSSSTGLTPLPVRYASVSIVTIGNNTATVGFSANGAGNVTFFIPAGNPSGTTAIATTVPNAWEAVTKVLKVALTPGEAYFAGNISPIHFGWETGIAVATNTYQPASYLGVSAIATPTGSLTTYTSNSETNGGGFFNISVAPGPGAKFTVGPGNEFDQATFYASVNPSNTSAYKSTTLVPANITIDHWGYLSSSQVNYSQFPAAVTVLDQAKGIPVWGASLVVSTIGDTASTATDLPQSNVNGQFFVDAPPGYDWSNVSRPVYEPNATRVLIKPSLVTTVPTINLTGDGVVAARVVSEPGNLPVANANITACLAGQRVCGMAQTNGTGVFWVNATPGTNFINVTANGFVSAGATLALVCSDCFVPLTPIPVYQPAYISGVLRGLPTGLPILKGNVSACSPFGSPTGPCLYSVQTSGAGTFTLVVPAGNYILAFTDPNYNSTYLSLSVHPGQRVNVGTVFLQSYGAISGAVYDNISVIPIAGASVLACPVWSGGTCVGAKTSSDGHYLIQGAPGPYVVTVSASGYEDLLVDTMIVGGKVTVAPTAFLVRLGADTSYPVSGTVYADGQALGGAVVAATIGGAIAISTVTSSTGTFTLSVVYGNYVLLVTASGEAPLQQPVTVHGPVTGLVLKLSTQTYAAYGVVTDGLTSEPLADVHILVGTTLENTTYSDGRYSVALANGTWSLTAVYVGTSGVTYGQEHVSVNINGAPSSRAILLYPQVTIVFGLVVDSASGAGLGGASVTVFGLASDGKTINESLFATASGAFQLQLPEGSYTVKGVYGGYANATLAVTPSGASAQLLVPLVSTGGTTAHATSALTGWLGIGVGLGAVAALGIVLALITMRRNGQWGGRKTRPPAGGTP